METYIFPARGGALQLSKEGKCVRLSNVQEKDALDLVWRTDTLTDCVCMRPTVSTVSLWTLADLHRTRPIYISDPKGLRPAPS